MIANGDITVYNQVLVDKQKKWLKTVIQGVYIYFKQKSSVSVGGMSKSNECTIRIPYNNCFNFVESEDYKQLEDKTGIYTVGYGDWICLKVSDKEIITPSEIEQPKIQVTHFVNNLNSGLPHLHIKGS